MYSKNSKKSGKMSMQKGKGCASSPFKLHIKRQVMMSSINCFGLRVSRRKIQTALERPLIASEKAGQAPKGELNRGTSAFDRPSEGR